MSDTKIYVAGHHGLVGSAIWSNLKSRGYTNLVGRSHKELDLLDGAAVKQFFDEEQPDAVVLAAAHVGGILANLQYRADFIYQNLQIQQNVIGESFRHNVKKLLFLYEMEMDGAKIQPLLVDVEHLSGNPKLSVKLDGIDVFSAQLDTARYVFEVPMPAVKKSRKSEYQVFVDGKLREKGIIIRSPQKIQTFADYVDTKIGTAHSRWMIAPGPWMPFSMVKLSPDNQNMGWQAGRPTSLFLLKA